MAARDHIKAVTKKKEKGREGKDLLAWWFVGDVCVSVDEVPLKRLVLWLSNPS
jgi:hypothetical protein